MIASTEKPWKPPWVSRLPSTDGNSDFLVIGNCMVRADKFLGTAWHASAGSAVVFVEGNPPILTNVSSAAEYLGWLSGKKPEGYREEGAILT